MRKSIMENTQNYLRKIGEIPDTDTNSDTDLRKLVR